MVSSEGMACDSRLHIGARACFFAVVLGLLGGVAWASGPGPSHVSVDGRWLILERRNPDGSLAPPVHYTAHGVDWSPAGRLTEADLASRRQAYADWSSVDIPAMAALGVDTVRLPIDPGIDAAGRAVLDELYSHGIMAIVTVDEETRNLTRIAQVVEAVKDHPAVLLWLVGNEWNINLYKGNPDCASVEAAAACTEEAAELIHSLDPDHPVATSYGDIEIDAPGLHLSDTERYVNEVAPSVDVWGVNLYRGPTFGNAFDQWRSISGKPLFVGEFGTDVLKIPEALPDEAMQAQWDLCLWNDLSHQLSSLHPELATLGGTVFEWNDEWWKVSPAGTHNTGGFYFPGAHPDDYANEEYFGLVDIDRNQRLAGQELSDVFGANPPKLPKGLVLGAASRGAAAAQYAGQYGYARFYGCGRPFYNRVGGGGGGRGFNAVVLDPASGEVVEPATNFDTYITRGECAANNPDAAMYALKAYLDAAPAGSVVLLAVADEAGLNADDSCSPYSSSSCFTSGLATLAALGSTKIGDYCFRDSWAMIAVKGSGALAEGLAGGEVVELGSGLPDPGAFTLDLSKAGSGGGTVTSTPAGIDCGSSCLSDEGSYPTGTLVDLAATPDAGSWFAGWTGDSDCSDSLVWMDGPRACTATFEIGCGPDTLQLRYHVVREPEHHQACTSIEADRGLRVAPSGRLELVSGQSVVLGDGFSVDAGGALTVAIEPDLLP